MESKRFAGRRGFPGRRSVWAGLLAVGCLPLLVACSRELPTFGAGLFPEIGQSVRERYCIRGAALGTTEAEGAIATTDCHKGQGQGYWDAYRVRVAFDAALTFRIESDFDSELELFRVDDLGDYWASRVQLAFDDDSAPGQDAMLSYELAVDVEYLIIVSGADDFSRGPYTLRITPA